MLSQNMEVCPMSVYRIRRLQTSDLEHVKPILEHWIRDCDSGEPVPEEVTEDLAAIRATIGTTAKEGFIVIVDESDIACGVMGLKTLDANIEKDRYLIALCQGTSPCELINAYLDPGKRGHGLGRELVRGLIALAREFGYDEMLVNSGRRYRETGWGFYDKLFGARRGVHIGRYGEGRDAPIWGMMIDDSTSITAARNP